MATDPLNQAEIDALRRAAREFVAGCPVACCRICGGWTKGDDHPDKQIPLVCPHCGDPCMREDWLKLP